MERRKVKNGEKELFSPFFTFLRSIYRPFRLSLVPTICPWVSEDALYHAGEGRVGFKKKIRAVPQEENQGGASF